ncbi:MAG: hypothetical protein QXJ17_00850 [Nitrososphaeria archaeon]
MKIFGPNFKYVLLIFLLSLTTMIPVTYGATETLTGPNTFFDTYYSVPFFLLESPDGFNGRTILYEEWAFAIRDVDTPTGKAGLKDFELFAVSYFVYGYDQEEGYFAETIVFGTLEYVEDGEGYSYWIPNEEYKVSGGGSFTVRPVVGPDYNDWERVVFKLTGTDSYGSKVLISGTYTCASGPPVYYINLMIKLTGQVFEADWENDQWVPTGRVETHTLKLNGYPSDYYYLSPWYVWAYAYPDQLMWFPGYWPIYD